MPTKLTESTENYLETILLLNNESPVVRVKDISAKMGVSSPSVHAAMHTLADQGFVNHERYGYVQLTGKGADKAREIYESHLILVEFLSRVLDVPPDIAERDACRIEHIISPETLECIKTFASRTVQGELRQ